MAENGGISNQAEPERIKKDGGMEPPPNGVNCF